MPDNTNTPINPFRATFEQFHSTDAAIATRLILLEEAALAVPRRSYYKPVVTLRAVHLVSHAQLVRLIEANDKPPTRLLLSQACSTKLWLEALATHPDNYTRKNHPFMPTTTHFMGLRVDVMTVEQTGRLLNPPPTRHTRGKGSRGAYKKTLHPEHKREQRAKAYERVRKSKSTLFIRIADTSALSLDTARAYVTMSLIHKRTRYVYVGMTQACRDKLWAEAQAFIKKHGIPHHAMHLPDEFMEMIIRIVQPMDNWVT